MTFRKGGAARRRDANEPAIIDALESIGCRVWQLHGRGTPDLLVYRGDRYIPMEVKSHTGAQTEAQRDTPWPIVRTVEAAIRVVGGLR